jgi:putative ABC transport system permease protein
MVVNSVNFVSVRIDGRNIPSTLEFIENEWKSFNPNRPFEYFFFDDNYDKLYRSEKRMAEVFRYFTFLAIFISCLGLFGLASFTAERKTKQIGIRKVLGASVLGVVIHLSRDFIRWVLIANLVAWPVAYYAMNKWLQGFAYRINIPIWAFFVAAFFALTIALLTVGFRSVRAALANPVEALRYE